MRTFMISLVIVSVAGIDVRAQSDAPVAQPPEWLRFAEAGRLQDVALEMTVDGLPFEAYWSRTIQSLFAFADGNSDGQLSDEEIRLVPSPRAIRLSMGTGFTPPVAPLKSIQDVVGGNATSCTREELETYYRRHGVGRVAMGYARLPHTAALTKALVQALDENRDGLISAGEFAKADSALRRLDTNDDELIGVGELVLNESYPGNWAANALQPEASLDLSSAGDGSLVLTRIPAMSRRTEVDRPATPLTWQIGISEKLHESPLKLATNARCESWSVLGPLPGMGEKLREELATADPEPPVETEGNQNQNRNRRPSRAWLTPLVDRDHNQMASTQEIDQWLDLQQQLVHGQLLIDIYSGGGLFELLDTNHDAALSVRELRVAWPALQSASLTADDHVDLPRIPNVVFLIVSQGYPRSLVKPSTSSVEWFRQMDRNSDGDVSRREFTGSPDAFARLDKDRDGLISASEAAPVP